MPCWGVHDAITALSVARCFAPATLRATGLQLRLHLSLAQYLKMQPVSIMPHYVLPVSGMNTWAQAGGWTALAQHSLCEHLTMCRLQG
jgi:hypothetical protein